MQIKVGSTQQDTLQSGTYSGLMVTAEMIHSTANTAFSTADYQPQNVQIKVSLRRQNQTHTIMGDNLKLLGTFNSLHNGYDEFFNGIQLVPAENGVKAKQMRTVYLNFGGNIRVNSGDTLVVEVTVNDATFSANVDTNNSKLDVNLVPTIGYETHIPQTRFDVVPQNTTTTAFNPGDNILRLVYLNFDKNDLKVPVVAHISLTSDRYDVSRTFNQLHAMKHLNLPALSALRYGTSLPVSAPTVMKGHNYLPQSLILFDGIKQDAELDQCRIETSYDGAQVAASSNYYGYITYQATQAGIAAAIAREEKHTAEKVAMLPTE